MPASSDFRAAFCHLRHGLDVDMNATPWLPILPTPKSQDHAELWLPSLDTARYVYCWVVKVLADRKGYCWIDTGVSGQRDVKTALDFSRQISKLTAVCVQIYK